MFPVSTEMSEARLSTTLSTSSQPHLNLTLTLTLTQSHPLNHDITARLAALVAGS